ncbi:phenazine biosynthesis-like domain-containing protein 1 isoform X1 [Glandiceps talaboti]
MASKVLPLYTVDAFTSKPFSGNPAAVCLLENGDLSDDLKQKIAAEMNLSETAYIRTLNEGDTCLNASKFELRWFTPTNEVPLCGHATVASAAVLFHVVGNQSEKITFQTKMRGDVFACRQGDRICLDFPLYGTDKQDGSVEPFAQMIKATVGDLPVQDLQYSKETKTFIIRLDDSIKRSDFESFKPDFKAMHTCDVDGKHVLYMIAAVKGSQENNGVDDSGEVYDFMSRFFSPWNGITEDPVTGSAHAVLASYWSKELKKTSLYARQASKRGGDLWVDVKDNGRVDIAGNAVILLKGQLTL